jgi:radical SAM superfamily enzyme YgiQ (UPF0313 family)
MGRSNQADMAESIRPANSAAHRNGRMMNLACCKVLMIYPRFSAGSFWNYSITSELLGARYPTIPLGLITLAAMLPAHWTVRLVNRNTEELDDTDLDWADLVMTGGMLFQQADSLRLIRRAQAHGKPIAIGGPDATSSPHIYAAADFRVLGEAEGIIDDFVAAWEAGERAGDFHAPKHQVDVTKSPVPRFDLLRFEDYLFVGVQFSRGCPFTCEFCDIIELYGRVPRTKSAPQMLAELDALYALGYRGHVDFVDDNLIGNKKAVRAFLPHLKAWQEAHDFPFEFSTEASINIADDAELLELMRACGFFAIFVGIESPDPDTLVAMKKKQNTRRSLTESVHRIYDAGIMVTAGFIIGFDSETGSIAGPMADFIEDAAIPVAMVGLLSALPNTQMTRRLISERRLYEGHDFHPDGRGDQCVQGLNFQTVRPRREILEDFSQVLGRIYEPAAFCGRVERLIGRLKWTGKPQQEYGSDDFRRRHGIEMVRRIVSHFPEWRDLLWTTFMRCYQLNPSAVRQTVWLLALFLHLGPYARQAIAETEGAIAEIDRGAYQHPSCLSAVAWAEPPARYNARTA